MMWVPPALSRLALNVATPALTLPVPRAVAPSLNVTVPLAALGVTVAVKVTLAPLGAGLGEEATDTLVVVEILTARLPVMEPKTLVAATMMLKVPALVGVPLKMPVAESNVSQSGKPVAEQPAVLLAEIVKLNAWPLVPRALVAEVRPGADTQIVRVMTVYASELEETAVTVCPERTPAVFTATGTELFLPRVAFPSSPSMFQPQQNTWPSSVSALLPSRVAAIAATCLPESTPVVDTATGTEIAVVVPLPSCPTLLGPQA